MSSGKKGKKVKCKTVDLMSFLADGEGTPTVPLKPTSWADEVEEDHEGYSSRAVRKPVVLPTAPRAIRHVDDTDIPTKPPYVAYLTNLPYEVDDEDLVKFFAELKISSIRLPKDPYKLRGYGYVEFEDRDSLIDALYKSNTLMKSRRVRVEVSNNSNDDRRGGRMGRDNRRDKYDDPERTSGDWRSGPRDEPGASDGDSGHRNRYDNRDRRDDRDTAEYENKPGAWRESSDRERPAFRDRGGFRNDDREREWSRFGEKGSRDRDGDREKGSSFGPRRNYADSDYDRDGPRHDKYGADKPSEPRTRPKLQLQPRTKPVEAAAVKDEPEPAEPIPASPPPTAPTPAASESEEPAPPSKPAPAPVPAANIFGAAKPVDTTAREREIEERLAKTYSDTRSKEEGEEKRKEGTWGKRNGEGRDEKERERGRQSWRSNDRSREQRSNSRNQQSNTVEQADPRGSSSYRGAPPSSSDTRGGADRDKREKEDVSRMPKAKDEEPPNFVASNKYSMLPDDEDSDNMDE